MVSIEINGQFHRALQLLGDGNHVFITGKAGTGKSTLLRHFLAVTDHPTVVTAPTGVAALNVGGETIHRIFGFPITVTPEFVLSDEYRPNASRAAVLRGLATLVIDEVSMVRADLLDSIDLALRRFGPQTNQPFGGVQMVLVGDPYQLPPVVTEREEEYFRTYYPTPFFFSSDALRDLDFAIVELEKIYRQQDQVFISLLNAVRTGETDAHVFDTLNTRYLPDFQAPKDEFWVTLTTTNKMADAVNRKGLEAIQRAMLTHRAKTWGEVEDNQKAVPDVLEFKVGAQIMLVNNDFEDRWVNGSMGVVVDAAMETEDPLVLVKLIESGKQVEVRAHTWEISRPLMVNGKLAYEVVGTYRHLPFKPAWAVTIHKSQGKTLNKAIVSLGSGTFADGQLYVALSRCTSMDGLVLKSEVRPHHVKVEREVTRFLARHGSERAESDGWVFVGAHTTGTTRFDRVIEVAAIVQRTDGLTQEFSTIINPMRDLGRAAEDYGISATDVEMAPTFAEAWPWMARRFEGCAVVAHNLPLLQTMMEREAEANLGGAHIDLGLGVDTAQFFRQELNEAASLIGHVLPEQPTALDLARATQALFARVPAHDLPPVSGYKPGDEARRPGRIQSRDLIVPTPPAGAVFAYADSAMQAATSVIDEARVRSFLTGLATDLGVSDSEALNIHRQVMETLVSAARRDQRLSKTEEVALARAARILRMPVPEFGSAGPRVALEEILVPGAGVCFTGSARDREGNPLERSDLHQVAETKGLKPVSSVTKKNTAVVVAADAASMSGKAKKARDFGLPVIGVAEFLEWASED